MEGDFHPNQRLIRNDRGEVVGIAVGGPITWGAGETGATVEVTISKGDVEVRGSTADEVPASANEWTLEVTVDAGALEPGEADATATAHIHSGDETHDHRWSQKVELV